MNKKFQERRELLKTISNELIGNRFSFEFEESFISYGEFNIKINNNIFLRLYIIGNSKTQILRTTLYSEKNNYNFESESIDKDKIYLKNKDFKDLQSFINHLIALRQIVGETPKELYNEQ